ncbi:prenyltransferase/squalene oxidase repeat-containing protein [Streptomyces sp. NRRL S-87]|uniref:prenyltransferase/squalene oxidase repeat-containing protein n=1 Tax=Streptomyces sp. NRRL S-87 TaxID=1463920 RepID=UPI0004C277CE|nr:prenyltransferase/squalene oxidase repeat-containing protein [Streptomyces sp. NRRL S-87]
MTVRRSAAALAATAVLCVAAAPAALAAPAAPSTAPVIPSGLYGKADPTYDGVWRQSFALLAQDTVGLKPAPQAVDWLTGQQCANGGFASFRADAGKACDAKTMLDTNATAAAVQALAALGGQDAAVKKSVAWLKSVQNPDGGWAYSPGPGAASDANSTSIVIGALVAAGEKPAAVKSKTGKSAFDGLLEFQVGCAVPAADQGAFAYQKDKSGKLVANADATAAATLAGFGKSAVVPPANTGNSADNAQMPLMAPECPAGSTGAADMPTAAMGSEFYLVQTLRKNGNHLVAVTPGADKPTPDFGNTADAVIAIAAGGHGSAAKESYDWLQKNAAAWAKDNPAGLGTLVLAAHAVGADPKSFGGTDLVAQLNATGPAPQAATASSSPSGKDEKKDEDTEDSGSSVWWIIGAGAFFGIGIGFLLSGRKKSQQL